MSSEQSQQPTSFPLSDPEIRQAVLDFHKKECCFDKRPMKYMTITSITPMPAYRYILETFVETRVIGPKSVPFRGGEIIPAAKPCPDKWSIVVPQPSAPPGNTVIDFTETSQVINCPTCATTARIVCERCAGTGTIQCFNCGGAGVQHIYQYRYTQIVPCSFCQATGRATCDICTRKGYLTCPHCDGFTRIRSYNALTITWSLDVKQFNTARGDIPKDLLDQSQWSSVVATLSSKKEDTRPINFPADPEITDTAARYVGGTMEQKDWRVIAVRQTVLEVPVVKADFQWKDHVDTFYIFGQDKQIHFRVKCPGNKSCGGCCCCGNSSCVIA